MTPGPFQTLCRYLLGGLELVGLALASAAAVGGPALAKCEMASVADLPVTLLGMRALLPAKINGQDVQFVVDSGAFSSIITDANAAKLKLPRQPLPINVRIVGATGGAEGELLRVHELTLAHATIRDIEFIVAPGEYGEGSVGLLGQNILGHWDADYDLANGMIRLWAPRGCGFNSDMAYWAGNGPESVIALETDGHHAAAVQTKATVYVNGVRLIAIFDTGSPVSMITPHAAAIAGLSPNDPGAKAAGYTSGAGGRLVQSWIAPVKRFQIGHEQVSDTRLRVAGLQLMNADMLLGMDFFLAHHIFVSNQQNKLYLTYNGGPIFNLNQKPILSTDTRQALAAAGDGAAHPSDPQEPPTADPVDAAGFARRGDALAARNELGLALADLGKAIDLAPTVADYRYQRGLIYQRNGQPFLAKADLDQALSLKPDDVPALIARARLYLAGNETQKAVQDLNAADKASAKEDDVHLQMAGLYATAEQPSTAIAQFSLWIDAHADDAHLLAALNGRCRIRALNGLELDKALEDCNRAIRNAPKTAALFDSRGLVHLRLGEFDKAIADYDASLAINPKLSWSLYGRGLAKQGKGLTAEGAADIAAALAIDPKLAVEVKARGLTS